MISLTVNNTVLSLSAVTPAVSPAVNSLSKGCCRDEAVDIRVSVVKVRFEATRPQPRPLEDRDKARLAMTASIKVSKLSPSK